MNELQVITNIQAGSINFNYEETKAELQKVLEEYQGAVFTDESIPVAKSINADLRKKQKAFDTRRKEVQKEFMQPYTEFDTKAKELIALFNEPINFIDAQVKGYEERKKAEKREKIEEIYAECIGEMSEYLPLGKIYNSKWENATTTIKSIKEDITQVVKSTEQAVETIKAMNSEVTEKALDQFKIDLSLVNAIAYINRYEQQKAEIEARLAEQRREEEERQKQAEIERIRAEERQRIQEEERIRAEAEAAIYANIMAVEAAAAQEKAERETAEIEALSIKEPVEDSEMITYKIIATAEEFEMIETYMNSIGVDYLKGDF